MPTYNGNLQQYEAEIDGYFEKNIAQPCLQIPKWANGAFAAELALKYLYVKEHASCGSIHKLFDLFYELPEVHKTELIARIKTQAPQTDDMLEEQLKFFSDAFVKSRYFYEYDSAGFTGLFDPFVKIVCEYALSFDEQEEPNDPHP